MGEWKRFIIMLASWVGLVLLFVFLAAKSARGAEIHAMIFTAANGGYAVILSEPCQHPEIAKLVPSRITLGEGYAVVGGKKEFFCYGVKDGLVITLDPQAAGWRIPVRAFRPMVEG